MENSNHPKELKKRKWDFRSFRFRNDRCSLRTSPKTGNPCAVGGSSTNPISGIPATATITAAYLYCAGSGSTVDSTDVLNGNTIARAATSCC